MRKFNFFLWFAMSVCAPILAESPNRVTIEDLLMIKSVLGTQISPQGDSVLFTLAETDLAANIRRLSLWKTTTGMEAIKLLDGARNARWAPDGAKISYLARHEGVLQIWLSDPNGSNPIRLTSHTTDVQDFEWAPNGATIALLAAAEKKTGIYLLDLQSRQLRLLKDGGDQLIRADPWNPGANLSWSPDGRSIAYSTKPTPLFDDDYRTDIHVVSLVDGTSRKLTDRDGLDQRPVWSPDGRHIAFRTSFGKRDRYADHGISVVAIETGEVRDILNPGCGFLDGPYWYDWSTDNQTLYYLMPHGASVQFFALNMQNGTTRQISREMGVHTRPSLSRNTGKLAFLFSDTATPWEVYVSPIPSFQPVRLTRMNPELEKNQSIGLELIRWKSSDGLKIEGLVAYPPSYKKGTPLPLLTILHGGPEGVILSGFSPEVPFPLGMMDPFPYQIFTANGYAVFMPNFRGSGGYGSEFRRAANVNWSEGFAQDVHSGIDFLIQEKIADPERLLLAGTWRSGSTKVISMLSKTERFRAAVALTPYSDLAAMYEAYEDFRLQYDGLLGGSPQAVPDSYKKHSPIESAHLIRSPLLIVHDETDWFIPSSQSLALHDILKKNNVQGELVLYRSFGPIEEADLIRRALQWMNRWVGLRVCAKSSTKYESAAGWKPRLFASAKCRAIINAGKMPGKMPALLCTAIICTGAHLDRNFRTASRARSNLDSLAGGTNC